MSVVFVTRNKWLARVLRISTIIFFFRYFHSSSNNATIYDRPKLLRTDIDMEDFLEDLTSADLSTRAMTVRPSTEWRLYALTNLTIYFTKMRDVGRVGAGDLLPTRIVRSKSVLGMVKDRKTGRPYEDNLCLFRCLAVKLWCRCSRGKCLCARAFPTTES